MWNSVKAFYSSDKWRITRLAAIDKATNNKGQIICSHCGKPIIHKYDCHVHHIVELDQINYNDYDISLNQDNLTCVHIKCHNDIHNRFNGTQRKVFFVWGSACSGKSTWVKETATKNDIILDVDSIYEAISINDRYNKPNTITSMALALRDTMLEQITMRNFMGNVYVLSTEARVLPRQRLINRINADEVIYIESTREECLERLYNDSQRKPYIKEQEEYINKFFNQLQI